MGISMNTKVERNDSFEGAVKKLEEIVSLLEEGKLTLDEMLSLYEEGIGLYRYCNDKLDKANQKITLIKNQNEVSFESVSTDDFKGEQYEFKDGVTQKDRNNR
ncbi:exodeoxyribonuclease VII small subunit [Clostridiaceae bacterium 35-E11]